LKESREVLKPETINRTHKPERDGFLWKNFGPVKILNVLVENTKESVTKESSVTVVVLKLLRKVRRDRVGHINLVVPIAHIWYFRSLPNKLVISLVFHLRN
jgi:DNA-directed RNA polymerase subunit beta'